MYEFSNQIFGGGGGYSPSLSYDPSSAFNVEPSMDYSFEPDYSSFNPNSFMDYSFEPDYSFDPFMDYSFEQDYSFDPFMGDSYGGPVATQNGTLIGVPDFNEEYIIPQAAQAFGNVPVNMPTNPLDPNPQLQFSGSQPNQVSSSKPAVTTSADEGGFFSPGGFGYEYLGGRLGETIGQFLGEQKYGTGLDVEGGVTGRPLNPRGLPGQTATLGASALELIGDYGIYPVVTAAQVVPEYVTGLDLTDSSLIDTPAAAVQPAAPEIPQGAPDSPQAFFEEYRSKGPLTPEQIARGEAEAARIGTTFNPETGFSRDPFLQFQQAQQGRVAPSQALSGFSPMGVEETRARLGGRTLNQYLNAPDGTEGVYGLRTDPQGRMIPSREGEQATGGLSDYEKASAERYARMDERKRRPGESRTQRDTRLAQGETERTLYGGYTEAQLRDLFGPQNLRAAKAKLSAGVDPITNKRLSDERRDAYDDALKTQILEERLINYRQEDPDKFEKARVLVEKMIQSNQIAPQDGNQYMLRALNLDKKSFDEGSESALMKIIRGVGEGSEGNAGGSEGRSDIPQEAIDALRSNPSKASEFDQYFGQGSSAQFL